MLQGEASPHPGVGGQEGVGDLLEGVEGGEVVGDIPLGVAAVVEGEEGIRELEKVKGHQELLVATEVLQGQQHRSPSGRERGGGTGHVELGDTTQETPPSQFLIFLPEI